MRAGSPSLRSQNGGFSGASPGEPVRKDWSGGSTWEHQVLGSSCPWSWSMTLLRGCPRQSMEVSFISGISKPNSECSLLSAALLGPSPSSWREAPGSCESRPGPGQARPAPSPCLLHLCWPEAGCSGLASSSDLVFFFFPVFFFLVTLNQRNGRDLYPSMGTEGNQPGSAGWPGNMPSKVMARASVVGAVWGPEVVPGAGRGRVGPRAGDSTGRQRWQ